MTKNLLDLKTINELAQYSFFIPKYQRGYRWTERQVIDLLEDIKDFIPREIKDSDDKTWYCLQPIVIKERTAFSYEVIDGQQRLTTIYLIWHYLNQRLPEEDREKIFSIDYETRKNTSLFLVKPEIEDDSNIDFYHISQAYKAIAEWFKRQKVIPNFDLYNFYSKFKFYTKVIWYETFEDNTISIFIRLNIGKISLTNAELIKALLLNSSNYNKEFKEANRIRLEQQKIATEWDQIEYRLQDDKLWYFLTNENRESNRIELIFDLIAGIDIKNKKDPYETFRFFSNEIKIRNAKEIEEIWGKIKSYYQCFSEWYNERELYHKIGFILYSGVAKLKDLYDYSKTMKKSEFRLKIDELIKNYFYFKKVTLKNLQYNDNYTKFILLLYNILTMLQNDKDDSYFPFDLFKDKKSPWDVEHIASVQESMPEKNEDIENWLHDVFPYIDETIEGGDNLKVKIKKFKDYDNKDEFKNLFNEIIDHFNHYIKDEEDVNGLPNLSLLLASINRGYKNSVFPIKRKTIIERDKSGIFIPICTKNVFLKYFSDYPPKISFWTKEDRNKYEEDLKRVLSPYVQWEEQNA